MLSQIFLSLAMFDSSGVLSLIDQSIYINISKTAPDLNCKKRGNTIWPKDYIKVM